MEKRNTFLIETQKRIICVAITEETLSVEQKQII